MKKMKKNRRKLIVISLILLVLFLYITTFFNTYSDFVNRINPDATESLTGISGNVVTLDDTESDYYYYKGLNYTYNSGSSLPSLENKGYYTDSNLVQAKITYSSRDLDNTLVGYVSLTERQDTYIYYKVYPVNDNGTSTNYSDDYINIELIENPFTDRPTDKGFHGWVSTYDGVTFSLDQTYFIRYAKVPVTYTDGVVDTIEITFNACWVPASVGYITSTSNMWSSVFSNLKDKTMQLMGHTEYETEDVSSLYVQGTISRGSSYPSGAVDRNLSSLSGTCRPGIFSSTCTYYVLSDGTYDPDATYYKKGNNGRLSSYTVTSTSTFVSDIEEGVNVAGLYKGVTINRNSSYAGYYNASGVYQSSGTCTTSGGCTYYEYIPYKTNGVVNVAVAGTNYYYLPSRDTNIVVMSANTSTTWSSSENKPFTLTSVHNGTDYRSSATWTVRSGNNNGIYPFCYNDTNIENIKIVYNAELTNSDNTPSSGTTTRGMMYGNYKNLRIGRGITQNGSYKNFIYVIGGSNSTSGSSSNVTKYRLIVESGLYDGISLTNGGSYTLGTSYVNAKGIYGNDYDRANGDNEKLKVAYSLSSSFGGSYSSSNSQDIGFDNTVKSGLFGENEYDAFAGIYAGSRGYGTTYIRRVLKYEGGSTYVINGGPVSASNRNGLNDTYIYMTGGEVNMIYGGAGTSATYGNRIIGVTGGTVKYSVFGGSNGYSASSGDGTVNGDSYVYIGGNAIIGDSTLVSGDNTLFGAEAGSVFGIGNGNSSYDTIGSNDNSNVIINDNAKVNRNVYGGGNYSSVGVSSSSSSSTTNIKILNGTVYGSVFGGGNNNGSGDDSKDSTVNVSMYGGQVIGSVYGGANQKGTVYGDANVNIYGGIVNTSVYGGGLGGYTSDSAPGTYIRDDVNVTICDSSLSITPQINGSVYGGSSFGTVNSSSNDTTYTGNKTNVTINCGTVGSVFGGGQGNDTYTPKVDGDVLVTINNGTIGSVFGGNDEKGMPSGAVKVVVNNGTIGETDSEGELTGGVFGGGNKTSLTTSDVTVNNGTITRVFGGSNQSGDVTTSNVLITGGSIVNAYGGNNLGGETDTSNIKTTGGNVTTLYGGGNIAITDETNVIIAGGTIGTVFGGGENADITTDTDIDITGGTVTSVYGGSNADGDIPVSYIDATGGTITDIYGGNNAGGSTVETHVTVSGSTVNGNVYGGGNKAISTTTYVIINSGTINSVFGGGNEAIVTTANTTINNGTITNVYGGGNKAAVTTANTTVKNGDITNLFGGGNAAAVETANTTVNGGEIDNMYGGSNSAGIVTNANITVNNNESTPIFGTIYGGNNLGGSTTNAILNISNCEANYIYGGGNRAETNVVTLNVADSTVNNDIYGGGNLALIRTNTDVNLDNVTVGGNVYGGGNAAVVTGNADLFISSGNITGSAYAGGNGQTAIVYGNTTITLEDNATVGTHVFGGGNAAITGRDTTNNSRGTVNIVGANISGNVYGGANTSKIYGTTYVNIGYDAVGDNTLTKSDIYIGGTVFGGGEANASGSTEYDYSFISVTVGININIDGNGHNNFDIDGSIFGSGNASSSGGYSYININNYGTFSNYKENISIQRADIVTINNSAILLKGTTDRVNEYSNVLFSLSRIDVLKLKNNSTLFMENGANLVQKFTSLVDVNGVETKASVTIDDDTKTVTKNVDNRLYMYEGKNFNVAKNQSVTVYGDVDGMTFLGMYKYGGDGTIKTAMYNPSYTYESEPSSNDLYAFTSGSYVLGKHKTSPEHDIYVDGFYSNFNEEDSGVITVKYIDPTPDDYSYYMWVIGEAVVSYEVELIASKYLTLGATELPLINHASPNSIFSILGVNYDGLSSDIELVAESEIPRIASTSEAADTTIGLSLKNGTTGWATNGSTEFVSGVEDEVTGTKTYNRENTNGTPSFVLYLYHSKNIGTSGSMGTITISLAVSTPVDDLNYDTERVNIVVTLSRALYNTNDYEATITSGKKYELFASSEVNITNSSSFSTYYSLYISSATNPLQTGYHRVLVSDYVFPENTKITMIDKASSDVTNYYYYVVSAADEASATREYENTMEVAYPLSRFIKMGSEDTSNTYSDANANQEYYDSSGGYSQEEFIFIVDFSEAGITSNVTDKSLLLELRNANENTVVNVLGVSQANMFYSIYYQQSGIIDVEATLDEEYVYPNTNVYMTVTTDYVAATTYGSTIFDTTFNNQKLGIKLTMYDSNGNQLSGADMLGISYTYNNTVYPVRTDGSTRINLASKVSNVMARIRINVDSPFAAGNYTIKVESFGSYDGIYYGLISSDYDTVNLEVLNTNYGLSVTLNDNMKFIDKGTGYNLLNNNNLTFSIECEHNLNNPKITLTMMRKNYDTAYSLVWDKVDLLDYTSNNYSSISSVNDLDYVVVQNVQRYNTVTLPMNTNLVSGTYKMVFSMYNGTTKIGEVYKYILIK